MNTLVLYFLISLVFIFIYAVFKFVRDLNLKYTIKYNEQIATHYEEKIVKNPHNISITLEKEALRTMRERYLKLKHEFKNKPKILIELAKDWRGYVNTISDFLKEKELFEIDFGDHYGDSDAVRRFRRRVAPLIIKKDKIEARFCRLLGINNISMKHLAWGSYGTKRK